MPHKKRRSGEEPSSPEKLRRAENGTAKEEVSRDDNVDEEEGDDDEDEDDESQEIVNVDFEFYDPKVEDFHGVKALVRLYLDDDSWDISGFVDAILAQTTVGSVIKTGEDESPIGLITALNIGRYKDRAFMDNVFQYLKRNCNEESDAARIEAIFGGEARNAALLVSERLINIPDELAPPLYKGLFEEITWATEDEPTKELQDSFRFQHYLIITRFFKQLPKQKKKRHKQKVQKENLESDMGDFIYVKPEDEILHNLSDWSCIFPVSSEALATHETRGLKQYRLVMLICSGKIDAFKRELGVEED